MKFFVTGNSSIKDAINLSYVAPLDSVGVNFASRGQTLQQSYSIAENIFKLIEKDKINFVLIGLTPDALFLDDKENFSEKVFEKNFSALENYVKLCLANGAKPVGLILPVAPSVRESYRKKFLEPLEDILAVFEKLYDFKIVNHFEQNIPEKFFADEKHLTSDGAIMASTALTLKLFTDEIISVENFSAMSYEYFNSLSYMADKNFFNDLLSEIYSYSVQKLRRKEKLKVAFVTDHAATWCGDALYNLFAQNSHFETTVFLCRGSESTPDDIQHDFEQFKAAGLNVVGVFDFEEETPPQDIIFYLRPYDANFSKNFKLQNLSPQTLLAYIPYSIDTASSFLGDYYNKPLFRLAWKYFFEAQDSLKLLNEKCNLGVPRGVVSGQPKLDSFFEDAGKFSFAWKMSRPDAKKIIWAPHHSFDKKDIAGIKGTFPHNFKFMYEFAKAHPETSWIVKPHPRLMTAAVNGKIFPSVEAYEEYLQAWNDLPNAMVYTGGYYQAIFATSDGMIHDSISFIAEYQYTRKPMIYLLNNDQEEFTELGKKILNVSYLIDGKNLSQIADTIQNIFIEGNDPRRDERQKVFDAELNYLHFNGMTASEFIYKNITEELGL